MRPPPRPTWRQMRTGLRNSSQAASGTRFNVTFRPPHGRPVLPAASYAPPHRAQLLSPRCVLYGELQQVPRYDVRLVRGLRNAEAHDEAVRRLPVRSFLARPYQLPVLPPVRTAKPFQDACHFVCLVSVNCCDFGQQKTRSLVGVRVSLAGAKVSVTFRLPRRKPGRRRVA